MVINSGLALLWSLYSIQLKFSFILLVTYWQTYVSLVWIWHWEACTCLFTCLPRSHIVVNAFHGTFVNLIGWSGGLGLPSLPIRIVLIVALAMCLTGTIGFVLMGNITACLFFFPGVNYTWESQIKGNGKKGNLCLPREELCILN